MFITEGIILKHQEIRDKERSYVVLTRDFGKIRAFHKESPTRAFHDIGSHVELTIDRKNEVNRLTSIRLKQSIILGHSYESISFFLHLLQAIHHEVPDGGGDSGLYMDLLSLIYSSGDTILFPRAIWLMGLRLIYLLGNIPSKSRDPIVSKLIILATENTLSKLLLIRGISEDQNRLISLEFDRIFTPTFLW